MSRGGARVWGNDHPAARLTDKKVIRYRNLVRSGKATVGEIAAKEGCSHGRISMAVRGETWQHLNDLAPPVPTTPRRTAAEVAQAAAKKATARPAAKRPAAKRAATKRTATERAAAKKVTAKRAALKTAATRTAPAKRAPVRTTAAKTGAKAAAKRATGRR